MKMRSRSAVWAGFAASVAMVLGACDSNVGLDTIDDVAIRDMALVAADATLEDVNAMGRSFGFRSVTGGIPSLEGQHPSGRPGGHHGFGTDGSGTTVEVFFDEANGPQDEYDELTTERIDVETVVDGEVSREDWTAMVHRQRQVTVTGLAGGETHRTYNGGGASDVSGSKHTDQGDRVYDMSGSFSYSEVVVPVPGSDPRYPISGTITRSMSSTRTDAEGTEARSMDMTVTFDGDETATVVVNGVTMEIDLSAREGRRPMRGRFGG